MTKYSDGSVAQDHYVTGKGSTVWGSDWEDLGKLLKNVSTVRDFPPAYTGDGTEASIKAWANSNGYTVGIDK